MSMCPGKKDKRWNRDLHVDMHELTACQIGTVVCLLEDHEVQSLQVDYYFRSCHHKNIKTIRLPIRDGNIPRLDQLHFLVEDIIVDMNNGINVLIHCRCGLGRAGLIAACCLVNYGWPAEKSIEYVREKRPKAIQTRRQEDCIYAYQDKLLS